MYRNIRNLIRKHNMLTFWIWTGISIFLVVCFAVTMIVTKSGLFGLSWYPLLSLVFCIVGFIYLAVRNRKLRKLLNTIGVTSDAEGEQYMQNAAPLGNSKNTLYWVTPEYLLNFEILSAVPLGNIIWIKQTVHVDRDDDGRVNDTTFQIKLNIKEPKRTDILSYDSPSERDAAAQVLQNYCRQNGTGALIISE